MKKIFYYTDVLPFLSRDREAINKLKNSLEIFKKTGDSIELVWHPYSGTREYLEKNHSEIVSEYLEIVEEYRRLGWGTYDESSSITDASEALCGCDAYYGDVSNLIYVAQNNNIPVMIQNLDV